MSASARAATPSPSDRTRAAFWLRACGLAALLLLPLATAAQPQDAHAEAGRAFDALRAVQPDRMPRLAEPESAAVLRVLGDAPRFLDAVRYGPDDLGALSDLCDRDRTAITAYTGFRALQQGQFVASVVVANILEFQEELAVLQPFLARCIGRQVPVAEGLLRQLGERKAAQLRLGGLKRSQDALLQLYAGVASCLSDPRFGPAYCGLLEVMAELAPVHARALPLASRAMVIRMLPPAEQVPPGPRRQAVQRIAEAMTGDRCTSLCLLGAGT
ncbi:MAG: hypothetical protein EOP80_14830 [Variovorax sp.]|nr:MAG: hypothetical protein EOP80_14830 [Variovorax sp.]